MASRWREVLGGSMLLIALGTGSASCAEGPVKIGAVFDLSGPSATPGNKIKHAIELAQDVINGKYPDVNLPLAKSNGLPHLGHATVTFVFGDDQSKPQTGATTVERLISSTKVVAVMGSYATAVTAAEGQAAERLGTPFLASDSVGNFLTERGYHWFFRSSTNQSQLIGTLLAFLQHDKQARGSLKIGIIADTSEVNQSSMKLFKDQAPASGLAGDIVADIRFQPNSPDLTSEVEKLRAARPTVVFAGAYTPDAILLMKTFQRLGFKPDAILGEDAGFNDPALIRSIGQLAEGILSREVWSVSVTKNNALARQVNDIYRKRFGEDMTGDDSRAFTGAYLLADAINRAGSTTPDALRQALATTDMPASEIIMPWGGIKFDAKGQNEKASAMVVQIQKGHYETVWPEAARSAPVVWPKPW
jgi:branched-chain amino acid transport system substrate-binding protein